MPMRNMFGLLRCGSKGPPSDRLGEPCYRHGQQRPLTSAEGSMRHRPRRRRPPPPASELWTGATHSGFQPSKGRAVNRLFIGQEREEAIGSSPSSGKTRPMVSPGAPAFLRSSLYAAHRGCRAWACPDLLGAEPDASLFRAGGRGVRRCRNPCAGSGHRSDSDLGIGRPPERMGHCGGRNGHACLELTRLAA